MVFTAIDDIAVFFVFHKMYYIALYYIIQAFIPINEFRGLQAYGFCQEK